jgi:hypothetical protein
MDPFGLKHSTCSRAHLLFPLPQLNVRMFGLPPDARVIERPFDELQIFEEGTWMDGVGVLFLTKTGEQHNISVQLDAHLDRARKHPFRTSFNGEAIDTVSLRLLL